MLSSDYQASLKRLGLVGCLAQWPQVEHEPWLATLIHIETEERTRRSLESRTRFAGLGRYKPICDFDWNWPKKIDRTLIEELLSLQFIKEGANVVFLGPNGVGKTMLLKNLAAKALSEGHHVLVRSASDILIDLGKQESTAARSRRLQVYVKPSILAIDEVGYLSYDSRHADLLFEVITRRYEKNKSILLTTNKPFAEWPTVFPNAACVVTLVDRLLHRADVLSIEGESYRLHEALDRQTRRKKKKSSS